MDFVLEGYNGMKLQGFSLANVLCVKLLISLNKRLGAQMNPLVETVLLSTHNTCFVEN